MDLPQPRILATLRQPVDSAKLIGFIQTLQDIHVGTHGLIYTRSSPDRSMIEFYDLPTETEKKEGRS